MAVSDNERFEQFSSVLLTELLERTKKNMELLQPEHAPCSPLPFAQTASFLDIYAEVVKVGIFPVVISRRPVRAILGDVDWSKDGREYLQTVLDDRSNAVFTAWDATWDALWDERKAPPVHHAPEKKKGGFLSSLLGRWSSAKPEVKHVEEEEGGTMAGLYTMLNELSGKRGYLPLFRDDTKIFKGLIRTKPGKIASAWKELRQYHHQEFFLEGTEQAKPGVLSDAMQKWQFNLAERIGELLIIKCAVDLECVNKAFIGKYIRQSARTQEEAEKGVPYLSIYWKSMPNAIMAQG